MGPIRHNEPPHANSPDVASGTVARRLRIDVHNDDNDNAWQRGDRYGPIEWAQQDGFFSLVTWHVRIPGRISIELPVSRLDHQAPGGDLEGTHVPAGWGGLILVYS